MRQFAVRTVVLSFFLASPAMAADMPLPYKAPPPVAPPSWTSCYLGGNVGVSADVTHVSDEVSDYPIARLSDTNVAGGGQIGCDYEFAGNWVIGIQGMFDGTGLQASANSPVLAPETLNGSIPWVATLTGRLGYSAAPNWLVYGKGGGAWLHTNSNLTLGGVVVDTADFDQSGVTGGGGIEWRFAPHWSVFAEYDYIYFPQRLVVSASGANLGDVAQHVQLGVVGVNFRFGGP